MNIVFNKNVIKITKDEEYYYIHTKCSDCRVNTEDEIYYCKKLIIATGLSEMNIPNYKMDIETNDCGDWDFYIPLHIEINKNETYDDLLEDLVQRQIIYKNKYGWKNSPSRKENKQTHLQNDENNNQTAFK